MGKALKPPPTDFTSPKSKTKSDTEWMKIIQDGLPSTTMPGYKGQLSEQQILDVLTYIRSLTK